MQPLLNFWAAFTPSEEVGILLLHVRNLVLTENLILKSGIGVNGIPKKCACYESRLPLLELIFIPFSALLSGCTETAQSLEACIISTQRLAEQPATLWETNVISLSC